MLGFTSIRQYAIVIVKHNDDTWSIYRVELDESTNIANSVLIASHMTEKVWPDDWDGSTKPLSLVTRWEADDNIKLYIANHKTELLLVNIAKTYEGETFNEIF